MVAGLFATGLVMAFAKSPKDVCDFFVQQYDQGGIKSCIATSEMDLSALVQELTDMANQFASGQISGKVDVTKVGDANKVKGKAAKDRCACARAQYKAKPYGSCTSTTDGVDIAAITAIAKDSYNAFQACP